MSAAIPKPDYEYVAYIDESGDQGLQKVKPLDPKGSSEWLIVSGVLIRKKYEDEATTWVNNIIPKLESPQLRGLHFRKLKPQWRQELVCREIAGLPLRLFVVCSNKKNMKGYNNPFAAQVPSQCWFYCWLTRVLLERLTHFVDEDAKDRFGESRRVKLVYSRAGGLKYSQMAAYYEWMRDKNRNNNQYLKMGDLRYATIHSHLLEVRDHESEPRLALADSLATAFHNACDKHDSGPCDLTCATLLSDRMARWPRNPNGQVAGYGVKLLPGFKGAALDKEQQKIFQHFGYPKQWWDGKERVPDPIVP